jgi:hypothetical protein
MKNKLESGDVGFEIPTTVVIKSSVYRIQRRLVRRKSADVSDECVIAILRVEATCFMALSCLASCYTLKI